MSDNTLPFSNSKKIISYGKMPIANGFLTQDEFSKEYFFELATAWCPETKMFHLTKQPNCNLMFHENYAFFSGTSKKMAEHFEAMANNYLDNFITDPKESFIVEIGSNDGIMLKHFAKKDIKHLGIEPSQNVAKVAAENGINTISRFFNEQEAENIKQQYGQADIISAANVMCHIADIHSVAKGISILLKNRGVLAFEDPYLGDVIEKTSYDQIYDEHAYIFSVQSIQNIFSRYGLEVFHVEPQTTHGGSMRYYLSHKNSHPIRESVKQQLDKETKLGLDKLATYERFAANCENNKQDLVNLLQKLKSEGKKVVGYAATSKSTTILNYCNIGPELIEYICDTTPIKQDKFSPGMHIPIKPYENFKQDNPDYAILFAWNHAAEIFEKEQDFTASGGKWIVFVPTVKILSSEEIIAKNVA